MKMVLIILGFVVWRELLLELVGSHAMISLFLTQAIYCRVRYFRDSHLLSRRPVVCPEVV